MTELTPPRTQLSICKVTRAALSSGFWLVREIPDVRIQIFSCVARFVFAPNFSLAILADIFRASRNLATVSKKSDPGRLKVLLLGILIGGITCSLNASRTANCVKRILAISNYQIFNAPWRLYGVNTLLR